MKIKSASRQFVEHIRSITTAEGVVADVALAL
jgi:hypothetical protein